MGHVWKRDHCLQLLFNLVVDTPLSVYSFLVSFIGTWGLIDNTKFSTGQFNIINILWHFAGLGALLILI